jgi:hypothetical protein
VNADRTVTAVYAMTLEPMTQELIDELDGRVHTTVPGRDGVDLFTAHANGGIDLWHLPYR